jgi:hypothetical protein
VPSVAEPELQVSVVISNQWCQIHISFTYFKKNYKVNTKIQRTWQKAVWSIDHTALNVAPPLGAFMALATPK